MYIQVPLGLGAHGAPCKRNEKSIFWVSFQSLSVLLGVCKYGLTISFSGNIDTTLTFLDDLVTDDLEQGGKPYIPPHLRGVSSGSTKICHCKISIYSN
jgi:hypothetical protein